MHDAPTTPTAFLLRRVHSFMGLWLVLFLIEHLFVNSQAALLIGDDGNGFVRAVNGIKNLPYLPVIEITLLGIPFLVHMIWGVKYLFTGESNSYGNSGTTPYLPQYARNHAYTWQRITSWILLFALIGHVVQMRFLDYPTQEGRGKETSYRVALQEDAGLASLSKRLNVTLEKKESQKKEGKIEAVTDNFGTAELLMVRETFKSPLMIALYTFFVLAAVFHGFNGLSTFLITWGVTLTARSQKQMAYFAVFLMILVAFLGLAAIWGTYLINLRQ